MRFHLETKRLTLHLRSPVHVGARIRQLSPMEAIAFRGRVYVIHEDRLSRFVAEHRLVDDLVVAVAREGERFDLRAFLEARRLLSAETLERIAAYSAAGPDSVPPAQQVNFRPLIRGGLGRPYLPGSSIKGAIRSALVNRQIAAMDAAGQRRISQAVDRQIQAGARRERFAEPVTRPLLQGRLPLGKRSPRGISGPHLDLLRCLKVSDSAYEGDTAIYPVQVLSLQRGDDRFYLKEQMLLECIPPGAVLSCSLTLDHGLLAEFRKAGTQPPFADLTELLALVEKQAEVLLDEEHYFFKGLQGAEALFDFYDTTDANLRLGQGSGLPATTILLSLPEAQRFRLRDQVFRMKRESQLFPKSRRVVTRGREPVMPLGWVRWEVAE